MILVWVVLVLSSRRVTELSADVIAGLVAEVGPVWQAWQDARRAQRPRRRAAGAGAKYKLVFVDRLLATLVYQRHAPWRPTGHPNRQPAPRHDMDIVVTTDTRNHAAARQPSDAGIEVHHFFLKVSREELEKRIEGRIFVPDDPEREERVRRWGKDWIEPCMAAADTLPGDTVFLDGELSPQELADQVLAEYGPVRNPARTRGGGDGLCGRLPRAPWLRLGRRFTPTPARS